MPAPKKSAPRYNVVNGRLSDEEMAAVMAAIKQRGMKITEYVRECVLRGM